MSTRPAPRPRPRPRPRAVTNNVSSSSPSSNATILPTTSPLEPVSVNVAEDADAMFFKNRNRTPQTWKKLNQLDEETTTRKPKRLSDDDSDAGIDTTPRQKKQKKVEHSDALPAWTRSADAIVLSSSDEEDELLRMVEKATPGAKRSTKDKINKRIGKRAKSRSRSITPPPELAHSALQHARDTVRLLYGGPRAPSPSFGGDDSVDGIELDPELAIIAKTAQIEARRQMSSTPAAGSRSSSPIHAIGPEEVIIKVRWLSHPLNPDPKRVTYEYKMRRNDGFRELFDETADSAGVLVDHIIISYEGKRVFPSASPHGIGVWDEAVLEGCDKATYEYLRTHRSDTPEPDADRASPSRAISPTAESEAPSEAGSDDDDDDDKMKLTFRSAVSKDIALTVRPTTKCNVILKAFLKRAGLSSKYPSSPTKKGKKGKGAVFLGPALMVDGERLDPDAEISSADLEDGDLVEVVGL